MVTTLGFRKAYAKQFSEGTPLVFVMFGEPSLIDDSVLEKVAKEMDLNPLQIESCDQCVLHFENMLDTINWLKDHPATNFPFHAIAMDPDGEYIADNSEKDFGFIFSHTKLLYQKESEEKEEKDV
jgi:hypothetical protein